MTLQAANARSNAMAAERAYELQQTQQQTKSMVDNLLAEISMARRQKAELEVSAERFAY